MMQASPYGRADAVAADFLKHSNLSDKLDLSPENVTRAVREWERVQAVNHAAILAEPREKPLPEATIEFLRMERTLCSPFDKSALLGRLLEGKLALREPAPSANGYPAYSLVEADVSHRVAVFFSGDEVIVEQCRYKIVERNAAAVEVQRLMKSGASFSRLSFMEAVASNPVFLVRFGQWPAWELTVGMADAGSGRRYSIMSRASGPAKPDDVTWGGWGPIEETAVQVAGEVTMARLQADLDALPELQARAKRGEPLDFTQRASLNFGPQNERELARGVADPRSLDWISYRQAGWILRRSAEWSDPEKPVDLYLEPPSTA